MAERWERSSTPGARSVAWSRSAVPEEMDLVIKRGTKPGDVVSVHYAGRLDDGTPFDSSEGRAPLSFTLGAGQVVAGFDEAVTGMSVDEQKLVYEASGGA